MMWWWGGRHSIVLWLDLSLLVNLCPWIVNFRFFLHILLGAGGMLSRWPAIDLIGVFPSLHIEGQSLLDEGISLLQVSWTLLLLLR